MACGYDYKLLFLYLQCYDVSWCNFSSAYSNCHHPETARSDVTQLNMGVLAGYVYEIYVSVVSTYWESTSVSIRKTIPPLDLRVNAVSASKAGRYGLNVYLRWEMPYSSREYFVSKDALSSCLVHNTV